MAGNTRKHKYKGIKSSFEPLYTNDSFVDSETNDSYSSNEPKQGKKKKYKDDINKEFKKSRTPIFDFEVINGEEVEAWVSGMKKYFIMYHYSNSMKPKMAIFNLVGKDETWLKYLKKDKGIS